MRSGKIIALDSPSGLKEKTFPLPIFELDPITKKDHDLIADIKNHKAIESVDSYGFKYHVLIRDLEVWNSFATSLSDNFKIRQIPPSLEDVFIRLVEGINR